MFDRLYERFDFTSYVGELAVCKTLVFAVVSQQRPLGG